MSNPVLPLASIRLDGGTQARAALDEDTIQVYAEAYRTGVQLPPPVVFDDGDHEGEGPMWLADGFHRVYGAQRAGLAELECDVRVGSLRDAILFAAGANAQHGLKRTNADKRRAVEMLLADEEWAGRSDHWIAEQCHVSHPFVASLRPSIGNSSTATRRAKDGRNVTARKDSNGLRGHEPTDLASREDAVQIGGGAHTETLGDEGAGVVPRGREKSADAPAPGEPDGFDLLGLPASGQWLAHVAHIAGLIDKVDGQLRALQGALGNSPLGKLREELHRVASLARSMRPAVVCAICRDPDGRTGTREKCRVCGKQGWLSAEQANGLHPAALQAEPKTKKLRIEGE